MLTATDAKGVTNTITYGAVNGYTGLYPTQTVTAYGTAIQRTSAMTYDFYTGLPLTATDVDNNLTNATEYDALGRPLKVKAAVGTASEIWTQSEYDVINRRIVVRSDLETKGDGKNIAVQHFDQMGRVRLSRTIENVLTQDPYNEADGIKVQTRYRYDDPLNPAGSNGSYTLTSNPYRAATSAGAANEESMGWTLGYSDKTGIYSKAETFAGKDLPAAFGGTNQNSTGVVITNIDANRTLVTDQAGKQRMSRTNALGQLTDVWEIKAADASTVAVSFPNQALSAGYQTSYQYDTLNNLTKVIQGTQPNRNFTYSSLSRLLSAANPESGTIGYVYDNNGNLTSKTDARNITTSYGYDALNRVTQRNYAGETTTPPTPTVNYFYDNLPNAKGNLIKVDNGTSKTEYQAFDIMGRVTQSQQTTDGTAYGNPMTYTYNLSGSLIEETYPSGRVVKNVLDGDGRLSIVQSKKNANSGFFKYAKNFTYTAAGAVSSMQLGNGKWESTQFNSRLQPTQIALGTVQNGTDKLKLDFEYGKLNWDGTVLAGTNNGNVAKQTITVPTVGSAAGFTAVQYYAYDELNRIQTASENITQNGQSTVTGWTQGFTYDRYGNRRFDTANTTTLPQNCATAVCNPQIDPATNRLIGYTFDTAGNTTVDATGRTFTYDAENKQTSVINSQSQVIGQYFYDGDGKRVKKVVPGTGETTVFVYDASGKMVAEYSTVTNNNPQVSYLTTDHLGSPRINTDASGAVTARHDYLPFGEEIYTPQRTAGLGYVADDIRQKFTGYERDKESGLDYAQARYYNSNHGRFTSVDPLTASASIRNPQTFNRYSYVLNSPYKFTDPLGLLPVGQSSWGMCSAEYSSCNGEVAGGFGENNFGSDVPESNETEEGVAENQNTTSADDSQQQAEEAEPPPDPGENELEIEFEIEEVVLSGDFDESTIPDIEKEIFDGINRVREAKGLDPLVLNEALAAGAREYAEYLATESARKESNDDFLFGLPHSGYKYRKQKLKEAGLKTDGGSENIGYNPAEPSDKIAETAVKGWVTSKGHYGNLMNENWKQTGVGIAYRKDKNRIYRVQWFISKKPKK